MTEFDCQRCRSWKDCPGKEWYSYGEVKWCPQQVFWLLKYADYLQVGWLAPDAVSCPGIRGKVMNTEAAFVNARIVMGELNCRLSKTGWKGRLLSEEARNREKMMYLSDEANDALYYVAGWRRKGMNFMAWLKQRKYRKNDYQNVVKAGLDK
jgi:hypothetical protein